MSRRIYTPEMIQFLADFAPGHWIATEILPAFEAKFGIRPSLNGIRTLLVRHKIKTNAKQVRGMREIAHYRLTTPEQDEWIKANAHGKTGAEIQRMIAEKFGLELTLDQIKSYKSRKKINTGLTGYFPKGNIPANKGKKLSPETYALCKATMFKKGNIPQSWRPVGSERIAKDGYIEIKVAEPNKWKPKQRVVWEQHHGEIPKGMKVIFADGNKLNISIDNLRLVSSANLLVLNNHNLINDNSEITDVGITLAKVMCKASEKRRQKKNV